MRAGARGATAGAAVQRAPSPARSAREPGQARRAATREGKNAFYRQLLLTELGINMCFSLFATSTDLGGLSRTLSSLTSREPTSHPQVRWVGVKELFDWYFKDQNGRLQRNGREGEDGPHSRQEREGFRALGCRDELFLLHCQDGGRKSRGGDSVGR